MGVKEHLAEKTAGEAKAVGNLATDANFNQKQLMSKLRLDKDAELRAEQLSEWAVTDGADAEAKLQFARAALAKLKQAKIPSLAELKQKPLSIKMQQNVSEK